MDYVLIEKNATVSIIKATQISMKPTTIIDNIAPININNPAVPNKFTFVFAEMIVNDLLKKMAETTVKKDSKLMRQCLQEKCGMKLTYGVNP